MVEWRGWSDGAVQECGVNGQLPARRTQNLGVCLEEGRRASPIWATEDASTARILSRHVPTEPQIARFLNCRTKNT